MTKALNFKQELTAAFGTPIAENPTQAMVEAAYRHHGLDWRYLTIEVSRDGFVASTAPSPTRSPSSNISTRSESRRA